jgi:hypothetical protein
LLKCVIPHETRPARCEHALDLPRLAQWRYREGDLAVAVCLSPRYQGDKESLTVAGGIDVNRCAAWEGMGSGGQRGTLKRFRRTVNQGQWVSTRDGEPRGSAPGSLRREMHVANVQEKEKEISRGGSRGGCVRAS